MPDKHDDPEAPTAPVEIPATTSARTKARSKKNATAKPTAKSAAKSSPDSVAPIERLEESGAALEGEVRLRAYLIYAERGFRAGSPESDWLQAEREVTYGRHA